MEKQRVRGGGVKVTYIETRFVTSDAAGFKDLVQRLTGGAVQARWGLVHDGRCGRSWGAARLRLLLPAGARGGALPGRRRPRAAVQ